MRHVLVFHLKLRPYECPWCPWNFAYKHHLQAHQLVCRKDDDNWQCNKCLRLFITEDDLKKHQSSTKYKEEPRRAALLEDLYVCDPSARFGLDKWDPATHPDAVGVEVDSSMDYKNYGCHTSKNADVCPCKNRLPVTKIKLRGIVIDCDPTIPMDAHNVTYGYIDTRHPEPNYFGAIGKNNVLGRHKDHNKTIKQGFGGCPLCKSL
jgi:Zinc finger, C2H2 type